MLIKCLKKLSFRNSPFSAPSPHPVSWRPRASPVGAHISSSGDACISRGTFLQQISKSFAKRPAQGSCRLGPVPGALIPGTHHFFPWLLRTGLHQDLGWESSHVWGVQSSLLLLRLDLSFHLKHQQLPSYSANKGTYTLPCFKKNGKGRNIQGSGFPLAEHVCFKHTALLESQNQLSGISLAAVCSKDRLGVASWKMLNTQLIGEAGEGVHKTSVNF